MTHRSLLVAISYSVILSATALSQSAAAPPHPVVLHGARLLDVKGGRTIKPGEVLVQGDHIIEAGSSVKRPADAEVIDLGDCTLLPGLIDAHIHLFLHPGAEDLQTVQESVPERTITATLAARDDLMAGFTAERDMGTEGAGSADTAVRNDIDNGRIPGPRLRVSGNAINILGGHEDAIGYNPAQHVLPNADYGNNADELVAVMRQQFKEGADFIKISPIATVGGPQYVANVRRALQQLPLVVTGNIEYDEIPQYLKVGVVGFGIVGPLIPGDLLERGDRAALVANARRFLSATRA